MYNLTDVNKVFDDSSFKSKKADKWVTVENKYKEYFKGVSNTTGRPSLHYEKNIEKRGGGVAYIPGFYRICMIVSCHDSPIEP